MTARNADRTQERHAHMLFKTRNHFESIQLSLMRGLGWTSLESCASEFHGMGEAEGRRHFMHSLSEACELQEGSRSKEEESVQGLEVLGRTGPRLWGHTCTASDSWIGARRSRRQPNGTHVHRRRFSNLPHACVVRCGFCESANIRSRSRWSANGRCIHDGGRALRSTVEQASPIELANCGSYLDRELLLLSRIRVVLALGRMAFKSYLDRLRLQGILIWHLEFKHGGKYTLPRGLPVLIASYHPSRQNTQTKRLTLEMMDAVLNKVRSVLVDS
jgi:hypothetical protein